MLSIGEVTSAGAASRYFDQDNYYSAGQSAPSMWMGEGSAALGLHGQVDAKTFEALLEGHVPGTDQRLGTDKDGVWRHRPGWDLTFSAPKSVTLLAMLAGDTRLSEAHDKAVATALSKLESEHASTRTRLDGKVVEQKTGVLVVAGFKHDLNRAQEPQLHTHAVTVNMTRRSGETRWRSLHSDPLYKNAKAAGQLYQQELAIAVKALGYEVDPRANGMFEIRGVDPNLIKDFATRREDVKAHLEAQGVSPQAATLDQRQTAAVMTRERKGSMDRAQLQQSWRDLAGPDRLSLLSELRSRAEGRAGPAPDPATRHMDAVNGLTLALDHLCETEAKFSQERLEEAVAKFTIGRSGNADINDAIRARVLSGTLIATEVVVPDRKTGMDQIKPGFTTPGAQEDEQRLIKAEGFARDRFRPLLSEARAEQAVGHAVNVSVAKGFSWTDGQRAATQTILTARNGVTAVQGLAGTAKTTTVLATLAQTGREQGLTIRALAPTAAAATVLGDAIGAPAQTVASHLVSQPQNVGRELWIVDEASLIGTKDMTALMEGAHNRNARLVLVGDTQQLASVAAGNAFWQLQQSGMQTARLDQIVRQTNADMRDAVDKAALGNAAQSIAKLQAAGGTVSQSEDLSARVNQLVTDYIALDPTERARTLILDPSREGRAVLNARVRTELIKDGTLGGTELTVDARSTVNLSTTEKTLVQSYRPGQSLRFGRAYTFGDANVAKHEMLKIIGAEDGRTLILARENGDELRWKPATKGAARAQVFEETRTELRKGDRIRWSDNQTDRAVPLRNGDLATVTAVNRTRQSIRIELDGGGETRLDLKDTRNRHFTHAYAQTVHTAQGQTSGRVLIHAESFRINLINTRSFYVALSRAREQGKVYTDNAQNLVKAIAGRAGLSPTALTPQQQQDAALKATKERQADRSLFERVGITLKDGIARMGNPDQHRQREEARRRSEDQKAAHKTERRQGPDLSKEAATKREEINPAGDEAVRRGPRMRR